jgi:tetratricopeptide (TPR) repeat protein
VPPQMVIAPGGSPPMFGRVAAPPPSLASGVGVAGPWPPPGQAPPKAPATIEPARPVRTDSARSSQLVTYGDRLFRSGNLHRAAERFEQAMNSDPTSAAPRVRLAQVALVRGDYSEAANRYREATIAEPGWLINAPDIQTIYGEPGDFHRRIAELETHLQAHPRDRDAWLVLGAQWYLSGRSRKAADVFLRLTDRKADPTLAAFLDASTPHEPAPK